MVRFQFRVSPERYENVLEEISEGSEPGARFYVMVAISTMIASFGLITNSTAVIIGAMLVAPLMTPIFGLALALIRGDTFLFGRALRAEIGGVAAAIIMGLVLGGLYPALEPTPEMLSRTEPQLFDLLVAVFSGLAGAYALLDEKLSPALPGVAIATAIVPPLANVGLCLSVGQYVAAAGSFLLFFANFLSILLVASLVFWLFGMAGRLGRIDAVTALKRFSLPVVCFVLVAAFLTHTLMNIARDRYLNQAIEESLASELLEIQDTTLEAMKHDEDDGVISVLADLKSSRTVTPTQVTRLRARLQEAVGMPVRLVVRSNPANEITALGSEFRLGKQQLDGSFLTKSVHPRVRDAKIADTFIRNYLSDLIGFKLDSVRISEVGDTTTVVATIYGVTSPHPEDIREIEASLKEELGDPDVRLIVSFIETRLYDQSGPVHLEFSGIIPLDEADEAAAQRIAGAVEDKLSALEDVLVSRIEYNVIDGVTYVLAETYGSRILTPEEAEALEQSTQRDVGLPVKLFVHAHATTVTTAEGYSTYAAAARSIYGRQRVESKRAAQTIIEASKM